MCVCIVFIHFSFLVMFYSCHIDVQLSHLNKDYLLIANIVILCMWPESSSVKAVILVKKSVKITEIMNFS